MKGSALFIGAAFGFLVVAARLSDYNVIHDMLRLKEFDVFLLMGSAVGVAAPLLLLMEKRKFKTPFGGEIKVQRNPVTKRTVAGAAMFGAGWAVAGTCPVPALGMLLSGSGLGAVVVVGLFGGIALRDSIDRKKQIAAPVC